MDILPIPPAPMRVMGVMVLARPTISSISLAHPKQGSGGGGNSMCRCEAMDHLMVNITDLA